MEATAQSSTQTPKNKVANLKQEKEKQQQYPTQSSVSTVPRTRSQLAPGWTTQEELILVNEVAAVEGDCSKALSSYQKWKIIVENCTAMEVFRPLNQCRKKWNSLLLEYNQIKLWDSKSRNNSYLSLPSEARKEFGLPENFDEELLKAIDNYVKAQQEHPDTDPDTDPEADADLLHVIAKLGSKRQRSRVMPLKTCLEEKRQEFCTKENLQTINGVEEPQESLVEEQPQTGCTYEVPQRISAKEDPRESHVEEELQTGRTNEIPQRISAKEDPQESHVEEQLQTGCTNEIPHRTCAEEDPEEFHTEEKPQTLHTVLEPQESCVQVQAQKIHAEGEGQKPADEKPKSSHIGKRKMTSKKEEEQMAVEKLCKNAELVHAIVNGKLPETSEFGATDFKSVEEFRTAFLRLQADKLIACLRDIVNIVNQFPYLVQKYD